MEGISCNLYKTCEMCGRTKWYKEFPSKGYRRRRSYCKGCKNLYSFDIKRLKESDIEVRLKSPSKRKKYSYTVSYEVAKILVRENMAGIVHDTLIHKFYDKKTFKKKILERDNYICFYCGRYGDTVDHIVPKVRGGISSFSNCICACKRCNTDKGDLSINNFLSCFEPLYTNNLITGKRVNQQLHYVGELLLSLNDTLVSFDSRELIENEEFLYKFHQVDQMLQEIKDYLIINRNG